MMEFICLATRPRCAASLISKFDIWKANVMIDFMCPWHIHWWKLHSELAIFFNNEPRRQRRPFKPQAAFVSSIFDCLNSVDTAPATFPAVSIALGTRTHSLTQGWGATARDIKTEFAASTAHHLGPRATRTRIFKSPAAAAHTRFSNSHLLALAPSRVLNENESSFEIIRATGTLKRRSQSAKR